MENRKPTKNKAVIYTRVSSERQVDNMSLDGQKNICRNYCRNKLKDEVPEERIFVEKGESAKTADRTELKRLFSYCNQHKKEIAWVVVYKIDRFSRQAADYFALSGILQKMGIQLLSATEPVDDNSNAGKLMKNMLACFAQFDNDVRGERSRIGLRDTAAIGGWTGRPPVGYFNCRNALKQSTLKIDEAMREPIQKFFNEFSKGFYTQEEAVKLAKDCGIRKPNGDVITRNGIFKMLRAPVYAGFVCNKATDGKMIKGLHEPLIDKQTYYRVQRILSGKHPLQEEEGGAKNKKNRYLVKNPVFPLRHFLYCEKCGRPLTGSISTGKTTKVAYYHCSHCTKKKDGCRTAVRLEKAHEQFTELLDNIEPAPWVPQVFRQIVLKRWNNDFQDAQEKLKKVNEKFEKIKRIKVALVSKFAEGSISDDVYQEAIQEYETQRKALEIERSDLEVVERDKEQIIDRAVDFLINLSKTWKDLPLEDKQKFQIAIFPSQISVNSEGKFGTPEISTIFGTTTDMEHTFNANKKDFSSEKSTMAESGRFELPLQVSPH